MIVLDTSVLISAALFPGSVPDQAVICAFEHFDVAASSAMLAELKASLEKPKHQQYANVEKRLQFYEIFRANTRAIKVTESITACRDPKDDMVLELAVASGSLIIVSGDKDLLTLSPFRGIEILSPRQFMAEFQ
ncbi:MAG: putative toxin-antitoxin system toxin component, PIN family [Betaproteobacteria bacterium]|nr:MAG: putative toxin-antitoxin system toxin component, PIN family [Betaproteobacteria bacterium]